MLLTEKCFFAMITSMNKTKREQELFSLFIKKIAFEENGCWNWTAGRNGTGNAYGRFRSDKQPAGSSHRWSYEWFVGPIPERLHIDHLCRNTLCVNPDHLEPVTPGENFIRSNHPSALRSRSTHCVRGHLWTDETIRFKKNGWRFCLLCNKDDQAKTYQRRVKREKKRNRDISLLDKTTLSRNESAHCTSA